MFVLRRSWYNWIMVKNITVEKVRKMSPKSRRRFFGKATPEQLEALTVPCTGEAHSNAFIDNCGCCMGVTWGRMLKTS